MADEKKGLDLIIDRIEALRVRINSTAQSAGIPSAFEHWHLLATEAIAEAIGMSNQEVEWRRAFDLIKGALALPDDTSPEDVAKAVRICTRRCDELERKVIALEDRAPLSANDQLAMMESRLRELEDAFKGKKCP